MNQDINAKLKNQLTQFISGKDLRAQLIRGGLGSAGIQVTNRVIILMLSIVLARSLGADGYGTYAYAFAIMGLLLVVAEAGIPMLLMRETAASDGNREWGLLRGALIRGKQYVSIISVIVSVFGLSTLWLLGDQLSKELFQTIFLMLILVPVMAVVKTIAHIIRGLRYAVVGMTIDMLLHPVLVLIIVSFLFIVEPKLRDPQYAMAAQVTAAVIVLIVSIQLLNRYLPENVRTCSPEFQNIKWFKSSIPFLAIGAVGLIYYKTDILMLGWFHPPSEVGVYQVAVQGSMLVAFPVHAIGNVIAPLFARLSGQGDIWKLQDVTRAAARIVVLFSLPIVAVFVLFGGALAALVFGDDFESAHMPLAILALGQLGMTFFGFAGFLLNMTGNERCAAKILIISASMNVVLNIALVPPYGVVGAAIATAISTGFLHVSYHYMAKKLVDVSSTPFQIS